MSSDIGLVLTGGGSRGAYQAGALKAVLEILEIKKGPSPFKIISGVSAGAINGAFLATHADDFNTGVLAAVQLWSQLESKMILRHDAITMSRLAAKWAKDLTMGGWFHSKKAPTNYLLDSHPLKEYLTSILKPDTIEQQIKNGFLKGFAVSATDYRSGHATTFFEGLPSIQPWIRSARVGVRAKVNVSHVIASAAIPILFEPVLIDNAYYGDGSVSLREPLSPAIHLGANKLLVIGIRPQTSAKEPSENKKKVLPPSLADISGVLLNSLLIEDIESDVERLLRINQTLETNSPRPSTEGPLRKISILELRPSINLGTFAEDQFSNFPFMLRHLVKGIGASDEKGWDFLSYFAFDSTYTKPLIELGYSDTIVRKKEISDFFKD